MVRFTVFLNGELVKAYDLDEPVIFIGRLPENNIPITNMGISRRHVKIELDPQGGYVLNDLNSLNGTLVNGKRVKKTALVHGDKITIGKYTIVYEDLSGSSAAFLETIVAEVRPEELRQMAQAAGIKPPMPAYSPKQQAVPPAVAAPAVRPYVAAAGGVPPVQTAAAPPQNCPVLIDTSSHVVYKLDRGFLSIGSDDEDDIFANGFRIGRGYAAIEQRDGGFYISAQKIMGKIKVDGKSLRTHRLEHKDRVEVGSTTFRFMENGNG